MTMIVTTKRTNEMTAPTHPDPTALLAAAAAVVKNAYAPYSDFHVGAALQVTDGPIVAGCNVENASYGLTNCAERTAIFSAVKDGYRSFSAVAVVTSGDGLPYPCGACRQVLSEFCGADCPVYIAHVDRLGAYDTIRMGDLLPYAFKLT